MKKHVVTGLIILLPLVLTMWIVSWIVNLFTDPFVGIAGRILSSFGLSGTSIFFIPEETVLFLLSRVLVLIFLIVFIITIGAIGRHFFFRFLTSKADTIIHRIPVISQVYKTSQELIETVLSKDNRAFKQVVLVPFPHSECLTLGLVTRGEEFTKDYVAVFVPTTPNPTSGYLVMYKKDEILPVDMTVEEALRYVISCGMLLDEKKTHLIKQPSQRE